MNRIKKKKIDYLSTEITVGNPMDAQGCQCFRLQEPKHHIFVIACSFSIQRYLDISFVTNLMIYKYSTKITVGMKNKMDPSEK